MVPITSHVLCEAQGYAEMGEAESLTGMCKGKGASTLEQLVCAVHLPSHFQSYLGLNHTEENTEIGSKDWDLNPDLLDFKAEASYHCCESVVP